MFRSDRLVWGVLCGVAALNAATTQAAEVGRAVSTAPDHFVSFTADPDYTVDGDMFGIRSRLNPGTPGLPDPIVDDSPTRDTDDLGIIAENDTAPFFGVVDTVNEVGDDLNSASWTFDIAGFDSLSLSIDFAAMGDFEGTDTHTFTAAIDGGEASTLFENDVDTMGSADYTMDSGTVVTLNDPMSMNGTPLTNDFTTLTVPVAGTGSSLVLTYEGDTDAGTEGFAFREVVLTGNAVGGGIVGDYDNGGQVEQTDLDFVLSNWGDTDISDVTDWVNFPGGGAFDGLVDQNELDGVLLNWGDTSVPARSSAVVPEPAACGWAFAATILVARRSGRGGMLRLCGRSRDERCRNDAGVTAG